MYTDVKPTEESRAAVAVPGLTDRPPLVRLAGLATIVAGITLALAGLRSWTTSPLITHLLVPADPTSHRFPGFIIGIEFVVLGRALLLRRWLAHKVITALVFLSAFVNAVGAHPHPAMAFTGLAIGVLLVLDRHRYGVEPDPDRVVPTLTSAIAAVVGLTALVTAWLLWRHPATSVRPPLGHAAKAAIAAMAGADGALAQVAGSNALHLSGTLMAVTVLVVLLASIVLFAPHGPPIPDPADRREVEALVSTSDADGLAPFALRDDKSFVFSPDGRAAIGYRVVSGVALFGGDPVGVPDSYEPAIDAFLAHASTRGWRPAGIGARGDIAPAWKRRRLRTIGIGDEAVVPAETFTLDTPRLRNVRQAAKRSINFGVTTDVRRERDIRRIERDEFLELATTVWGAHGPRGFSMNLDHLLDGERPDGVIATARDATGSAVGFERYLPSAAGRMLSLDTMVRVADAPNGVHERMITDVIAWARENGISDVSLNFAAFRELFENDERGLVERLGYWGAHRFDRYIKVESLYRFNNKFRPQWVPRSVVFRSWVDIGWLLIAAVQAEFGLRVPGSATSVKERSRELLRSLPRSGR
ncbi:MAG: phosphatidylglycerol lysyltransferase domain-containing protein [Acidimicrobiales bacterium]